MKVYQIIAPKVTEKKIKAESPMEAAKKVARAKHDSGSSLKEFKIELSRKNKTHVYNVKLNVTKEGLKIKAIKLQTSTKQEGGGNCLPKLLCRKNKYLDARSQSVESIVKNHENTIKPVIINPESNFVVVTYWWGKGNLNRNTQKPCPEDLGPKETPSTPPVRYEVMINRWIDMCKKVGCNYLVEEFPEFAKPGMYQHAINAKPLFIKAALDACSKDKPCSKLESDNKTGKYKLGTQLVEEFDSNLQNAPATQSISPKMENINKKYTYTNDQKLTLDVSDELQEKNKSRAVLYIDGDMLINKYPALFDIENVDFMARGWNSDPRSSDNYQELEYICYDQYVFETSGGTMYFGNTKGAREILDLWHLTSSKPINKGKADDRILSLIFNAYAMVVQYNVIQLPIEYLWLTDIYGNKHNKPWGHVDHEHYTDIIIEHPACLTGEERAADQGASSNRQPKFYGEMIDNQIVCNRIYGKWYEEVFFADLTTKCIKINTYPTPTAPPTAATEAPQTAPAPTEKKTINPRDVAKATFSKYVDYLSNEALVEEVEENEDGEEERVDEYCAITGVVKGEQGIIAENKITSWNEIEPTVKFPTDIAYVYRTPSPQEGQNSSLEIQQILTYLAAGKDVIYVPEPHQKDCDKTMQIMIDALMGACEGYEFVGFNIAKPKRNNMELYQPFLSRKCPLFFSHKSRVVRYLLAMCTEIYYSSFATRKTSLNIVFNSSHVFISRIRCKWLDPVDYDFKKVLKARRLQSHYIEIVEEDLL